ncbi:rCG54128, isoform CRA_a [Rattus norvegicus]|uniref:BOS complex subunit TMEM147 n=1 Tax=Rattus norvegicus TaxID=10116 RepID=A6JA16_RAT|nr:rCG54128, isoform CRA_a [Rattus norvegicus]
MTLFHFGNCFALAYFPYFITYKCSGLSEYNAFWKCVQAGVTYLFVQLCKVRDSGTPGLHVSSLQAFQISGTRLCLCHLP